MTNDKELQELARTLRNKKAREWARKNKDKVKEINKRHWLKKAQQVLDAQKKKGE